MAGGERSNECEINNLSPTLPRSWGESNTNQMTQESIKFLKFINPTRGELLFSEVLQEILHRYTAIHRKDFIQKALDALYGFIDEVTVVTEADVLGAKELVLAYNDLSSRDAVHASHMKRLKIETIFSFDQGFDHLPHLKRIPSPALR